MATINYDGKKVVLVPGQLILDSGMNVFGLHLFMESCDKVPDGIPTAFAFEHRGIRVVVDRAPDCGPSDESLNVPILASTKRLQLKEGREHLTITNEFQSDKYPWCPVGFVPIKITDPLAMDLLSQYANRRRVIDSEFTRDLDEALAAADIPADNGQNAMGGLCDHGLYENENCQECADAARTVRDHN